MIPLLSVCPKRSVELSDRCDREISHNSLCFPKQETYPGRKQETYSILFANSPPGNFVFEKIGEVEPSGELRLNRDANI
jgi:hypothetical protein